MVGGFHDLMTALNKLGAIYARGGRCHADHADAACHSIEAFHPNGGRYRADTKLVLGIAQRKTVRSRLGKISLEGPQRRDEKARGQSGRRPGPVCQRGPRQS